AVLLPGYEESEALTAAESIIDRISTLDLEQMGSITVSSGVAVAPYHARERDELLRLVDGALYWAKEYGKNQARSYRSHAGKLALPEELLRKPGPLTDPERLVLERHPQIGYRMLDSLGVDPVADWVLHHHERWDGAGYPDQLEGEEIPLGARIIFVADAYDAMTSDRIYRPRLSSQAALAELERCEGTQFDPGIVAAFVEELGLSESLEAAPALPALAS